MIINTARLEGDNPTPPGLIWGQGPDFNNRLVQEINNEFSRVDLVIYRLEVDNITNAILAKFNAGVPVRLIVDRGSTNRLASILADPPRTSTSSGPQACRSSRRCTRGSRT
jgi:hypothetical protein